MISCGNYDYIEIVCMFKYPLELTMKSGDVICGQALDTTQNPSREECLKLRVDSNDVLVVLDAISTLKVTVENPHFNQVSFD